MKVSVNRLFRKVRFVAARVSWCSEDWKTGWDFWDHAPSFHHQTQPCWVLCKQSVSPRDWACACLLIFSLLCARWRFVWSGPGAGHWRKLPTVACALNGHDGRGLLLSCKWSNLSCRRRAKKLKFYFSCFCSKGSQLASLLCKLLERGWGWGRKHLCDAQGMWMCLVLMFASWFIRSPLLCFVWGGTQIAGG